MPITLDDFAAPPDGAVPGAASAAFDPARPFLFEGLAPRFATRVVHSVFIPMRDGVRLSTDFHIPLGARLPLPVVLARTCYGKASSRAAMQALLPEQGFVYAVQDVRGRCESEGVFVAGDGADREDGYDTVDWLAGQDWCSGAVGAMGSSYLGETAAKLAAMRHPAHRCSIIMFDGAYAGGNSRNGAYLQGGATLLRMLFGWFRDHVPKVSYGPPPHVDREAWFSSAYARAYATQPVAQPPVDAEAQLRTLPVFDMLDRSGAAPSDFSEMMRRAADPSDRYWADQGFLTDADRFHTPTLHVTGSLDVGGSGFDNFRLMRENAVTDEARDNQHLWFTPAPHSQHPLCGPDTRVGARAFGDTSFPYHREMIAWFGRWLRGEPAPETPSPKVRYFSAGDNAWRTADGWPPADVRTVALHLRSGGRAGGVPGDGRLTKDAPGDGEPCDRFTYDPGDPTPSEPAGAEFDLLGGGYADRSVIEQRPDVLVFTSAPLDAPLSVAGPVRARLHVGSSAVDTDFVVVLTQIDASGRSVNVTHGLARCRYREGLDRKVWMRSDEVYAVDVDLWHAAVTFARGERIRVTVASSHFPVFDRNLNTGGDIYTETDWRVAENTVHHDAAHPSAIYLPVRAGEAA